MTNKEDNIPIQIGSPIWFQIVLILLGAAYLAFELSFNAYLVDTATMTLTDNEVENLEKFGRTLSGVGLMLLVFGWIRYNSTRKFQTLIKMSAFGLFGFMLMFIGQKALIDYMVDKSTPQQRKDSQYIILMKTAMVENAINIEGVEHSPEEIQTPKVKTFLNTVGLLSFLNSDFVNVIRESSRDIVVSLMNINPREGMDDAYGKFDKERMVVYDSWEKYLVANKELKAATSNESLIQKAEESWDEVESGIKRKWQDILIAKKKYNDYMSGKRKGSLSASSAKNQSFIKKSEHSRIYMKDFFESYRLCHEKAYLVSNHKDRQDLFRDKCLLKTLSVYNEKIHQYTGKYIDYKEFCTIHPDSRKSLNWEEPFTPKKILNCPGDQAFIINKAIAESQQSVDPRAMFIKQTGFEPQVTYNEFLQSKKVSASTRDKIIEKGIYLDEKWTPFNDDIFKNKVVLKIREAATENFKRKSQELSGVEIPPYLNFDQFTSLDIIQNKLRAALKTNKKVDAKMSEEDFYKLVIEPEVNKVIDKAYEPFSRDKKLLGNGEQDEILGKQYVKAVIIPPIAMLFSLFFAVVNMVFLTMRIVYLLVSIPKVAQVILNMALMTAIVILPLQIKSGLGSNSIANYFVKSASQVIGKSSMGLSWLMNFQPIAYPAGEILKKELESRIKR